jgi:hypothetical protein
MGNIRPNGPGAGGSHVQKNAAGTYQQRKVFHDPGGHQPGILLVAIVPGDFLIRWRFVSDGSIPVRGSIGETGMAGQFQN